MKNTKWIPVNKRKPKPKTYVLVYAPNCKIMGSTLIGMYFAPKDYHNEFWIVYDFNDNKLNELVTHWMPLPKKP